MTPGVRTVPGLTTDDALALAHTEGAAALVLDTTGVSSRTGVLVAAGRALGAGDDFGVNLDALYDVLRDLDSRTVIAWSGWSAIAEADPGSFEALVGVFEARTEDAELLVLLVGPLPPG